MHENWIDQNGEKEESTATTHLRTICICIFAHIHAHMRAHEMIATVRREKMRHQQIKTATLCKGDFSCVCVCFCGHFEN